MSPEQTTLFEPPARLSVRRSDPLTSHIAARSVDLTARQQEVLDSLRLVSVAATASELVPVLRRYGSRMDIGSVRSRLNELGKAGKVRKVGQKAVPKPMGTGRPEFTWMLT
jgi:Fe2+ or Zn2+ uptake regulation protein